MNDMKINICVIFINRVKITQDICLHKKKYLELAE